MVYIVYNPDRTIKTFMEQIDDVVLTEGETFSISPLTMAEYARCFEIKCKGKTCTSVFAKVGDPAVVIDVSAPGDEAVPVSVNGLPQLVPLTDGRGSFEIATDQPGQYACGPWEKDRFSTAGSGSLYVTVSV